MKEKKELQSQVKDLASSNKNIKEENQKLKDLIAMQNRRLETLERIALGNSQVKDLASKF